MNDKNTTIPIKRKNDIYSSEKSEDFSHIKGDVDDFIFSFLDNKKHSEK
ncbi:MAG: hypothetical protein Q8873_01345 [Bacillota bacterium]|nr:hypothetical protein [Bacillota bacterium]